MNINELKKRIADAGCVGAGGAGFPTAVKVAEGADSLIINAAECEPLLYTDYYVMKRAMERIASGAETVMEAAGIPNGYLGVKAHTAKRLGLSHGDAVSSLSLIHIFAYQCTGAPPAAADIYSYIRRGGGLCEICLLYTSRCV